MVLDIFLLLAGLVLLVKGADWFVGGSSRIAEALRIPPLVIGLTLVSMGTSAPEASVSIVGAVNGMSGLSVGNVLGSNIFNTLLILGVSASILPLCVGRDVMRYDIPVMLALYVLLLFFAFAITPLKLDIFEAVALIVVFAAYTAFLIIRAVRAKRKSVTAAGIARAEVTEDTQCFGFNCGLVVNAEGSAGNKRKLPLWASAIMTAVGLACVIYGGDLVVDGASRLATAFGMSEALVGLTIGAVGTS
ncbi:MAG: hypothetical protein K2L54_02765, partial [Clostridiales bacterium]|nr:hypothetical protein [Clostridiales bacterium]